jgi:catechol 2,3-dioxygenase-like lactoylglutathione lyase family enzyme
MARSYEPLSAKPVSHCLAAVAFLVPDYDDAIAWFRGALGFDLIEDAPLGADKRWVVVAPPGGEGARLVLAKAADAGQREVIGRAAGGRVAYFLETDDFARDHAAMSARGVRFLEPPRREAYGVVAVFADPWGGRWDLLEPAKRRATVAP